MNIRIKRIGIALLVVLTLISIVFIFLKVKKPSVPSSTSNFNSWNSITPGTSTESDVTASLGKPKEKIGDTLYYGSKSPTRDNQISLQGGVVGLVKESVAFSESRKTSEITSKFGDPTFTLFGPEAVNGQYLFVYPDKGVAFIGNPVVGSLFEVWYFLPTTIDLFTKDYAPDYSLSQKTGAF